MLHPRCTIKAPREHRLDVKYTTQINEPAHRIIADAPAEHHPVPSWCIKGTLFFGTQALFSILFLEVYTIIK